MNTIEQVENPIGPYANLTRTVIGCAIEVHRTLGPGLLESTYERCLSQELQTTNLSFKVQVSLPVLYKGANLDCGYRVDLLVDDCLIVEIKAVENLTAVHQAQVLTYMKLAEAPVGLLINFNVTQLIKGLKRFVL